MEILVNFYIKVRALKLFSFMELLYAYQENRSTVAALYYLVQKIQGSLNNKKFVRGMFLDIDGTFENAYFGSMDAALRQVMSMELV
jgi:hypothetical protein